ncbi:MAG TPA: hypothetical protein VFF04_01575 [Candidatus Babeliales bacterium]|nr:hypothetical protein [Candidatus Babeliales bacterium]
MNRVNLFFFGSILFFFIGNHCSESKAFFDQAIKVRVCNNRIRTDFCGSVSHPSKLDRQLITDRNNQLDALEKLFHKTCKADLGTIFADLKDTYLLNKAKATKILLTSKPELETNELKDVRKFLTKDFRILLGGCCDHMFDGIDSGQCA